MNYIFFFPDEMRADSVSCYGNSVVKMPNYDKLAKEGVRFENCFVQHPVCSPSRCSLLTGWYPHVRGHRTLWNLLRDDEPSLFKYMKEAGYNVVMYGKNDVFSPEYFKLALDDYTKETNMTKSSQKQDKKAWGVYDSSIGQSEAEFFSFLMPQSDIKPEDTHDMKNVNRAMEFLKNHKKDDKPFMIFLPLSSPHPPYIAPNGFYDMYKAEDIPDMLPADIPGKPELYSLIRKYRGLGKLSSDFFKKIMAVYLGMNSYDDWMLGQLLDVLKNTGLEDETTVIVSSDHGDWAGDYGIVEKWPSALDDKIVKVPLIIKSPGNKAAHVVKEQVELFDIMATVMELSNIKAHHNHFARSLVPQLSGACGDPDRAVFAEGGYDINEPNCFEGYEKRIGDIVKVQGHVYYPKGRQQQEKPESVARSTMIRTLEYKLIRRTSRDNELYDMKNDPNELNNLYNNAKYINIQSKLESRLLEWYIHTSDVTPHDEHPRGLPKQL